MSSDPLEPIKIRVVDVISRESWKDTPTIFGEKETMTIKHYLTMTCLSGDCDTPKQALNSLPFGVDDTVKVVQIRAMPTGEVGQYQIAIVFEKDNSV